MSDAHRSPMPEVPSMKATVSAPIPAFERCHGVDHGSYLAQLALRLIALDGTLQLLPAWEHAEKLIQRAQTIHLSQLSAKILQRKGITREAFLRGFRLFVLPCETLLEAGERPSVVGKALEIGAKRDLRFREPAEIEQRGPLQLPRRQRPVWRFHVGETAFELHGLGKVPGGHFDPFSPRGNLALQDLVRDCHDARRDVHARRQPRQGLFPRPGQAASTPHRLQPR